MNSNPRGASYGEWSARHWEWLFSLPTDSHPLFDTADGSEGQSGKVWFIGGTFTTTELEPGVVLGEAHRDCTIPSGTSLFFPILSSECSTIEGDGDTEEELRACAQFLTDFVVTETLFLEIDGTPVSNLEQLRAQSPLFVIGPLPENNVLGADAGEIGLSVSDGYWVMLPPLSVGEHNIKFGGVLDIVPFDFAFILDIEYDITVVPRGQY